MFWKVLKKECEPRRQKRPVFEGSVTELQKTMLDSFATWLQVWKNKVKPHSHVVQFKRRRRALLMLGCAVGRLRKTQSGSDRRHGRNSAPPRSSVDYLFFNLIGWSAMMSKTVTRNLGVAMFVSEIVVG